MPEIPALGRQRRADLCESEASLVYKREYQDSQSYIKKPCLGKKNTFHSPDGETEAKEKAAACSGSPTE